MALMTAKEYIDSLRKLNTRVYMFGEKIDNWVDHPMIRPSINCVAMTYALAQDPQYEELMTATSSLTGHKINRFTHLHQSSEDLVKKVKMQRLLGQKTASCFQRCVGMDAFNAVYLHHLRDRREVRHPLSRELQKVPGLRPGQRPDGGRRHDRPQGRPQQGASRAGRSRYVRPCGGAPRRRHRGLRREVPPDRLHQQPLAHLHAHHRHGRS